MRGLIFTVQNIVAPFAGAYIFPLDMNRGMHRLSEMGTKGKTRLSDQPPPDDIPIFVNDEHIGSSIGPVWSISYGMSSMYHRRPEDQHDLLGVVLQGAEEDCRSADRSELEGNDQIWTSFDR